LQARLLKEQPGRAAVLHKRACAWFEQNNFRSDAIRHALAARDFEHAADLVELERSVTIGKSFQSATWLGWVKALPDELVRERAGLSLGFAWECLFSGELEAADARLNDADRLLSQPADPNDPLKVSSAGRMVVNEEELRSQRVSFAIARAYLAQALGNVPATEKHARQALALIPARDHSDRALASAMLGITCLSTGDLETAYGYMADSVASLRMTGNLVFANSGTYVLAEIRIAQGRLWDAIRTYEQALQLVTAQGNLLVEGTADLYLGLSKLYREQGNPEAASRHLQRAQELGKQAALPEWPYQLYLARAPLKEDQGDLEGALALLDEAERLHHRSPVPDLHPISAWKTRVWIRQGRLAEAIHWTQGRRLSVNDELSYRREFEHVTLARVLIACYKSDRTEHYMQEALGLVERLLRAAEEGGRLRSVIEILLLQVLAQEAQGNIAPALASLERALTLAEPEGYVRIFVDEGLPILGVLKKMKGQTGTMRAYVHKLLAAFGRPEEAYPASLTSQLLIEPLSERELEVLQLLAQGLSNHEIGRRLFVALDTVKGHNRKIFDKLGVKRRTEAVARARELGLL
jgi:LuxR family maltose regulon positive regulatory protein